MRLGKITENALKRSVIKQIRTAYGNKESAAVGSDCAFSKERKVFSATAPVTYRTKEAGFFAATRAVNSILSQGIVPDHVTVDILLEPNAEESFIRQTVAGCIRACNIFGIEYAGGHTEVTDALNRPLITANCVGYAKEGIRILADKRGNAGDSIVMSKWAGLEGTAVIVGEKYQELTERFPVAFIDDAKGLVDYTDIQKEAKIIRSTDLISSVHDVSNGGIFAALWELAEKAGTGLRADLKAIPIRQETVEICEYYELNPYELISGGALLYTTNCPDELVQELDGSGVNAAVIGRLEAGNDRILGNSDEVRFLELPKADEIHKIL